MEEIKEMIKNEEIRAEAVEETLQTEEPVQPQEAAQPQEVAQVEEPVQPQEVAQVEEPVQPQEAAQPQNNVWRPEEKSPYSPLYIPDNKKNSNKITIVFVTILILCLIAGLIFAVSKLIEAAVGEVSTEVSSWQESFDGWKEDAKDFFASEKEEEDGEDKYEEEESGYDGVFEYNGNTYVPSPSDKYYVEFTDSIEDTLSYSVEKEEYTYYDAEELIGIYVEYVTIDGLDFDDKINEKLEEGAMYYAKQFGAGEVSDLTLQVFSYVTYMDEDTLSVVVDERYTWDNESHADVYCMNFDLKTGSLLYNTKVIEPTEKLAEAFRDMSEYQNGYIEHIDEISDKEIVDYFSDENSLILFFTPVGMEIGFNYDGGWVTATLKDYEKYLSRL